MVASEPLRYHLDLQYPWCDHFLLIDPALANTSRRCTYQWYARVGVFTIKLWDLDEIQLQKIEAIPRKHDRCYKCSSDFFVFSEEYFWMFDSIQVFGGCHSKIMYNSHDPRMLGEFQVCSDTVHMPSKGKPFPH